MINKIFTIFFIAVLFTGCTEDDPASIGAAILDEQSKPIGNYDESLVPLAYTVKTGGIKTSNQEVEILGSYEDPIFGNVSASFVAQFQLPADPFPQGEFSSIDLKITYKGDAYPNNTTSLSAQTFEVFEYKDTINPKLSIDNDYYSDDDISTKINLSNVLGTTTIVPNIGEGNILSIVLDPLFGQALLDSLTVQNNAGNLNNSRLRVVLEGLYVKSNNVNQLNGEGTLMYLDMTDFESKLTLYSSYMDENGSVVEEEYRLRAGNQSARYNVFEHDYSTSSIAFGSTVATNDNLFIQPLDGSNVLIKFGDSLSSYPWAQGTINNVTLALKVNTVLSAGYEKPSTFEALELNNEGELGVRYEDESSTLFYTTSGPIINGEYRLNITKYIDKLVKGESENNGLLITPIDRRIAGDRVVFNGFNSILDRSRVIITYTTP
ncbi:MAG: DUF4270 family protein [Flavobacteriales bacterium]|nr:DUF4270 family protein [Flavobacteriales bacterium]